MRSQSPIRAASSRRKRSRKRSSPADREPLHFVLVGIGVEAEQLGHAAVEIAQRIRDNTISFSSVSWLPAPRQREPQRKSPARSSVSTVASSNGDAIVSRGGVRRVMLHHHDAAVGKRGAQLQVQRAFGRRGKRPHDGHAIHLLAPSRPPAPGRRRSTRCGRSAVCRRAARASIPRWRPPARRPSGRRWRHRPGCRRFRE